MGVGLGMGGQGGSFLSLCRLEDAEIDAYH